MKFYYAMWFVIIADLALTLLVSMVLRPVHGTLTFTIVKDAFFGIWTVASVLQLIKVGLDMVHGYVIVSFGTSAPRRYEWRQSPGAFVSGVVVQMLFWAAMSLAALMGLLLIGR